MPLQSTTPPTLDAALSYALREPCRYCGSAEGRLEPKNGQQCIFCANCGRLAYNAPKTETGLAPRTVTTNRANVKPNRRVRLLERANGGCELCGARGLLHVGHILSVADATAQGLPPILINSDENLMVLCEECNLGEGAVSLSPRLYAALLFARGCPR